jgi:hypothetical protein
MKIIDFIIENKEYLEDIVTRSTYHSNAIEGSTLTYAETYAILFNDNNFKINNKEPREIYQLIIKRQCCFYLINYKKMN